MRTLKIIEHISLDGVIQHSADDGAFPYSDWSVPWRLRVTRPTATLSRQGFSCARWKRRIVRVTSTV